MSIIVVKFHDADWFRNCGKFRKIILITQFQTCDRFKTTKTKAKFYVRDLFSALNNENVFKMFDIMIL